MKELTDKQIDDEIQLCSYSVGQGKFKHDNKLASLVKEKEKRAVKGLCKKIQEIMDGTQTYNWADMILTIKVLLKEIQED